jgi:protein AFG1
LNRSLFLPFIKELQKRCEVWRVEGGRDYKMRTAGKEKERETVFFTDAQEFEESLLRATNGANAQTSNNNGNDELPTPNPGVQA